MDTVILRKAATTESLTFDMIYKNDRFHNIEEKYTDINFTYRHSIIESYLKWEIFFGLLDEADLEFLYEYEADATTEVSFDGGSNYDDVYVKNLNAKHQKGSITLIKKTPE